MNLNHIKEDSLISVSDLAKELSISRSQINKKLSVNKDIIRSINLKRQYLAHISHIKKRAFQSGIALIDGHVFSTENDIISAMLKCIKESKWGRTRESFKRMFRCSDLDKSFKKLEKRDDIVKIKLEKKFLYLCKDKKEEQLKKYYQKKGIHLREKEKQVITTALIFSVLQYNGLDKIEQSIRKKRNKGGRKPYPIKAMINAILFRFMYCYSSFEKVTNELENDSNLAVALGFDLEQGTPSASCLSRFVQELGQHKKGNVDEQLADMLKQKRELKKEQSKIKSKSNHVKAVKPHERHFMPLEEVESEMKKLNGKLAKLEEEIPKNGWYHIFADLVLQLLSLQIIDGKFICLDGTHINTSKKDPNMSYGVKRAVKQADGTMKITKDFFGYKLHIAVDAKTNLPIAITITTGCVADNTEAPKIIRQLKRHGICFKAFLADGGYNDKKVYAAVSEYNKSARCICPLPKKEDGSTNNQQYYYDPKTKEQYKIHYNTEEGKKLFKLRGPTENINKIIKSDLDMGKPKVRGIRAIESLAYIHCIAILILAIATMLTGREQLTNQFSKVVK